MPDSSDSTVIGLIFSQTPQNLAAFQNFFTEIITQINATINTSSTTDAPDTLQQGRLLDADPTTTVGSTGRIFEFQLTLPKPLPLTECKSLTDSENLTNLQTHHAIELILQPLQLRRAFRARPGLAVFDMDSTLIQQEVIDELARSVGLYSQVAEITAKAMRGEAGYGDFAASLRARVALLRGVEGSIWEELRTGGRITFTPGAGELVRALRREGWRTAVLSGGFVELAGWVRETLGMDYAFANHLASDSETGALTGELIPGCEIVDGAKKRELLLRLAGENAVPMENTIAVGDGANDLLMMGEAGLGIAVHAKPKVQKAAPMRLNGESLVDVLYVLGYNGEEVRKLTRE